MSYEEKIERILGNKLEYNGNNGEAIIDVKIWLRCEWHCGMIEEMSELSRLLKVVDDIAEKIIKNL